MAGFLMTLLMLTGLLLMFIILLQRGRGGGLAGALGGMGGQSAFGTRAGDVFTRITIVLAVIWVVLAGVSGFALRAANSRFVGNDNSTPAVESAAPADGATKSDKSKAPASKESTDGEEMPDKSSKPADSEGKEATPSKDEPSKDEATKEDGGKPEAKKPEPKEPEEKKPAPKSDDTKSDEAKPEAPKDGEKKSE